MEKKYSFRNPIIFYFLFASYCILIIAVTYKNCIFRVQFTSKRIKMGGSREAKKISTWFLQNLGGEEDSQIIMVHKLSALFALGDSF